MELKMESIYLKESARTLPQSSKYLMNIDFNEKLKMTKEQAEIRRDQRMCLITSRLAHKDQLFLQKEKHR